MSEGHQEHPIVGYSLYSTPFSRNDASNCYMGWASALPPTNAGQGQALTSGNGQGEGSQRGFHDHFATPGGSQSSNEPTPGSSSWTIHANPAPYSSPFLTPPPNAFRTREESPRAPAQSYVQSAGPSTSVPVAVGGAQNSAGTGAEAQASAVGNTSSCPVVPSSNNVWSSRLSHLYQRDASRPVTGGGSLQVPIQPRNQTLVSYTYDPLQKSSEWSHGPHFLNFDDSALLQRSCIGDDGFGDRGRRKMPVSPLDNTYPPVAPYLTYYTGPLDLTLRGNFTTRYHVLRACNQIAPIPIDLIFESLRRVYKVNEGVFGEVYSGLFNAPRAESVYKLVPIEGSATVNGEVQKRFEQIETEIRVSQRLNTLCSRNGRSQCPGFCQLFRARVLSGAYPQVLVRAWNKWHREHQSDNDVPSFGERQLYVVFEYEHCGTDIESFKFQNAEQTFMVLLQVAFSLAVAESALDFEHRDLHWGNILVRQVEAPLIQFRLDGVAYEVPSAGLKTSIIDFTMARCNDETGNPIFDDLSSDEAQFTGTTDYQFEIYRKMRQLNNNNWSEFHPRSNVFWLHYLADKFLKTAYYTEKTSQRHKTGRSLLEAFFNRILNYDSCVDYVKTLKHYIAKPGSPPRPNSARR